ncbi:hypothetical protein DENSPDRAFT_544976 [Dentipellis sp. KUC8613]|nr:hypothetical protein DENSPDRAFT_544976 [Dentipellis sp. KUC8613]
MIVVVVVLSSFSTSLSLSPGFLSTPTCDTRHLLRLVLAPQHNLVVSFLCAACPVQADSRLLGFGFFYYYYYYLSAVPLRIMSRPSSCSVSFPVSYFLFRLYLFRCSLFIFLDVSLSLSFNVSLYLSQCLFVSLSIFLHLSLNVSASFFTSSSLFMSHSISCDTLYMYTPFFNEYIPIYPSSQLVCIVITKGIGMVHCMSTHTCLLQFELLLAVRCPRNPGQLRMVIGNTD